MADAKITELVAGTLSSDDLLTFVDDPSGTPVNKKIAYSSFLAGLSITESQISDLGSYLSTADIDTLAELNAIVADDTIIGAAATDASSFGFVVDEDNLASNLDTKVPTQQSVKAYVDSVIAGLTALEAEDIDTLAEINAIIGDATLVTVEATDASGYGFVIDEDDMVSDSATKVPTQQSVKAYVDAEIAGVGGGSGGLTVTAKTAGYTAANGDLVVCDSSGGAFNVTMPASPTADDRIGIYLEAGSAAAAVTVQGNGKVLAEYGTAVTLQTPGDVIVLQYDGTKWVIESNGIQTYSLSLLAAGSIDETADYIRLADGDATEDYEKRVTVKSLGGPYIEDSTLGTAAGDIFYRPSANDHWTNLPAGEDAGLGGVPNYPIASQAEAEAGTATNRLMNPLRTAQAIAALESGGSPVWGDITGTLADQTDLQAAIDAAGGSLPVADTTAIAKGSVDATKLVRFEVDGLTTGTTRVITMPDADVNLGDMLALPIEDGQAHFVDSPGGNQVVTIGCTGVAANRTATLVPTIAGATSDVNLPILLSLVGSGVPGGSQTFEAGFSQGSEYTRIDAGSYYKYVCRNSGVWYNMGPLHGQFGTSVSPAATDDSGDGFSPGSNWLDTTHGALYFAVSVGSGAAVWRRVAENSGLKTLSDGATVTIDADDVATQRVTLGGNRTLAFSNFKTGQKVCLRLTQDGTGSRTVTWPSSGVTINWAGGSAPTLTTTASKADWIVIVCTDDSSGAEVYDAAVAMANV